MTKDEIIKLMKEAGELTRTPFDEWCLRFANLVAYAAAAVEREACAKVCETEADNPSCLWEEPGCWQHAAENCAGSIRARGNT